MKTRIINFPCVFNLVTTGKGNWYFFIALYDNKSMQNDEISKN